MSCLQSSLDFAKKQLAAFCVLTGVERDEVYDRGLEELRHSLLILHSWVSRADAAAMLPLIDLLTSLHCGSLEEEEEVRAGGSPCTVLCHRVCHVIGRGGLRDVI
ncbi:unnamed protein product [Symbiodinium sp. CCMP2592]|nr:unnamed protein product [Symbiodinium sp. CCMP2592]